MNKRHSKYNFQFLNFFIFNLFRIIPKSKKVWIYSSWLGQKYADNAKYFFNFMCEEHKEIKSVWITRKKSVKNSIIKSGKCAYLCYEPKGIFYRIIAGVQIYTHSLYDFGDLFLGAGSFVVNTFHAMPIKKIGYDSKKWEEKLIQKKIKQIKDKIFNREYRNLAIATSLEMKKIFMSAYDLQDNQVVITGQPRNQFLKNSFYNRECLKTTNLESFLNKKVILYMPTFRRDKLSIKNYHFFLAELIKNNFFLEFLEKNDLYFIIKFHFHSDNFTLEDNKRIFFLSDDDIPDVQNLLAIADINVTDYSGCFIDFLLLNKPIIFLAPDLELYEKFENGLYFDYDIISGVFKCVDLDSFIDVLDKILKNQVDYLSHIEKLNKMFNTKRDFLFNEGLYYEIIGRI